jgi:2-dehydro-3-deoxyphosphogalactonate aldolase
MTLEEALAESGIIAIVRGVKPDEILGVAEALYSAGVRTIEVPLNSPDPYDSINRLASEYRGRVMCGGGTMLTPAHVEKVCGAGGRLAVAPNADPAVIRRAVSLGMTPFPGFATASEAFLAYESGARFLKLFPASTYGAGHLKALKAVLPPEVVVAPVGGVGPGDIAEWRAAGAGCFGIGSDIYKPGMATDEVHRRAVALVKADKARG